MDNHPFTKHQVVRVIVVISIMFVIAIIHIFRLGSYFKGDLRACYYAYASDIMIPFAAYFLLSLNEIQFRFLQKWYIKALTVFAVMTFSEIMQYFGIYFFGDTFDWLDILMFGIGVSIAVCFDTFVLKKLIPFWNYKA